MIEAVIILAVVCAIQSLCLPVLVWRALVHEGRFREVERTSDAQKVEHDKLRADHDQLDELVLALGKRVGEM